MFIEPKCGFNTRHSLWEDHSVNGHFILQSRELPKRRSFLQSLGARFQHDLDRSKDCCATLNIENCKYRILTRAPGPNKGYVIAIDNTLKAILNDWNSASVVIAPELERLEREGGKGIIAMLSEKSRELNERSAQEPITSTSRTTNSIAQKAPWLCKTLPFLYQVQVITDFECVYSTNNVRPTICHIYITPRAAIVLPATSSDNYSENEVFSIIPYYYVSSLCYKRTDVFDNGYILGVLFTLVDINIRLFMKRVDTFTGRVNSMIPQNIMIGDFTGIEDSKMYLLSTPEIISMPFRSQLILDLNYRSDSRDTFNIDASRLWTSTASTNINGSHSGARTLRSSDLGVYGQRLRHQSYKPAEKKGSYIYKPRLDESFLEGTTSIDDLKSKLINAQFAECFFMSSSENLISSRIVCYIHDKHAQVDLVGVVYFSQNYLCFSALSTLSTAEILPNVPNRDRKPSLVDSNLCHFYSTYTELLGLINDRTFTLVLPYTEILEVDKINRNISQIFDWVEMVSSSGLIAIKLMSKKDIILSFINNKDKMEFCDVLNKQISKLYRDKFNKTSNARSRGNTAYITPTLSEKLRNSFRTFKTSQSYYTPAANSNVSPNSNTAASYYNITNHPAFDIFSIPSLMVDDSKKVSTFDKLSFGQDQQPHCSTLINEIGIDNRESADTVRVPLLHLFPDTEEPCKLYNEVKENVCKRANEFNPNTLSASGSDSLSVSTHTKLELGLPKNECHTNILEINMPWEDYFYTYVDNSCATIHYELIRHLLLQNQGAPHYLRDKFYRICIGPDFEKSMDGVYSHLSATKLSKTNEYTSIIEKDVRRSMPNHPAFKSEVGINALSRLLNAYSWRNPEVGYAQSFNIIAAVLLLYFEEERVFIILSFIVEHLLTDQYTKTLSGTVVDQYVFTDLIETFLPKLQSHTMNLGIDIPIMTISWFICIFQNSVSHKVGIAFLDSFLLDGPAFLFWASLAILDINQDKLMQDRVKDIDFLMILKDFFNSMSSDIDIQGFKADNTQGRNVEDNKLSALTPFQRVLSVAYSKYCPKVTSDIIHVRKMKYQRVTSDSIWRSTLSFNSRALSDSSKFGHEEVRTFLEVVMYVKFVMCDKHSLRNSKYNLFTMKDLKTMEDIIKIGFWDHRDNNGVDLTNSNIVNYTSSAYIHLSGQEEDQVRRDQLISFNDYRRLSLIFAPWKFSTSTKNIECKDRLYETDNENRFQTELFHRLSKVLPNNTHELQPHVQVSNRECKPMLFVTFSDRIYYYCLIWSIISPLSHDSSHVRMKSKLLENLKPRVCDNTALLSDKSLNMGHTSCFVNASAILNAFEIMMKESTVFRLQFIFKMYDVDGDGYVNIIELIEFCLGLMEILGFADNKTLDITKKDYIPHDGAGPHNHKQLLKEIKSLFTTAAKIDIGVEYSNNHLINRQILLHDSPKSVDIYTRMLCQLLYSSDQKDVFLISSSKNPSAPPPRTDLRFCSADMGNSADKVAGIELDPFNEVESMVMDSIVGLYKSRMSMKLSFDDIKLIFVMHRALTDCFEETWKIVESNNPRFPGIHAEILRCP